MLAYILRDSVCCPQILACVFVVEMQKSFCWVIQLFSLVCTVKGYYDREYSTHTDGYSSFISE